MRIPDGCRRIPVGRGVRLIAVKSPCDWVCSYNGLTAVIDTKTIDRASFPFNLINPDQVRSMNALTPGGTLRGYVIWFRKIDRVVFISCEKLKTVQTRGSVSVEDGIDLGPLDELDLTKIFS
jgi:penicillin-binding protein-related factor A (putative recombinase)